MSNISVFEFDSNQLEVVIVDGHPWFNASQVAKALGYANPSKALQDNVSPKYNQQLDLGRRGKKPNFINEPGLYQLIMRSTLPSAERFQDWVFEEVLPSIRETGSYSISQTQKLGAYTERVESMFDDANKIPDGYWCVLHESANLLIWVESKLKLPVNKADLLDGSIGAHWSNYRKGKDWAGDRLKFDYKFPDGRWCHPWCYRMRELEYFRYFIEDTYKPVLMPRYLDTKYPALATA